MSTTGYILRDEDAHVTVDFNLDPVAFVLDNDLDPDEVNAILTMPRGGVRRYGGGASPSFILMRVGIYE